MKNRIFWYGLLVLFLSGLSVGIYNLPPVKSRLDWRLDELRAKIKYILSPPEQVIFVPSGQDPEDKSPLATIPILLETPTSAISPKFDRPLPANIPIPIPTLAPTAI